MIERVGPYRVEGELGRGGMGIVYRAVDERLGRAVALKTLPGEVAQDPGRLERFEREARTLASLNHAHLAGIYGVEEDEAGNRYLALELVEGETLADRLDRGVLPVEEALDLAVQIAAGVEAAHEAGVVHRDLKPANIKVTPEGVAKVLDFGLAKADEGVTSGSSLSQLPTQTSAKSPTMEGAILGTAAYMSPEQARGRKVDKRSDIWSFGVVVYEMLCGASPFVGETVSDSIGAILHKDVDLARLPAGTPAGVRRVLGRCVERDKNLRYRDIGDVRVELLRAKDEPAEVAAARAGGVGWLVAVLVGMVCLMVGGGAAWMLRPADELMVAKVDLVLGTEAEPLEDVLPQISPDGLRLAYIAENMIQIRELDSFQSRALSGTEDAVTLFWSPDGEWVGYTQGRSVYKVRVAGGGVIKVCDMDEEAGVVFTGGWTADGRIVFRTESGLYEVSALGGQASLLLAPGEGETDFHQVRSILGTDALVFVTHLSTITDMKLEVLNGSRRVELLKVERDGITSVAYSPTGHVLYSVGHGVPKLWAVGFDVDRMELTGEPFQLLEGATYASVSGSGTLAVKRGVAFEAGGALVWVDPSAESSEAMTQPVGVGPELESTMVWGMSPNGRYVAVTAGSQSQMDLWLVDLERKSSSRLTFDSFFSACVGWSPDSSELAVFQYDASTTVGSVRTRFLAADGSGESREPLDGIVMGFDREWDRVLVRNDPREGNTKYSVQALDGTGERELVYESERGFGEDLGFSLLSPDGDLLLVTDNSSGSSQVFCLRLDGGGGRYQISTVEGKDPTWSPDGDWVYFEQESTGEVMRASVEWDEDEDGARGALRFGMPEVAFNMQTMDLQSSSRWAFGLDGRYLSVKAEDGDEERPRARLSIVTNWFEEFRER